jgi:hypothetical protein
MFSNESGFSTSQKKDDQVGGQKIVVVVESGTILQIVASTIDHKSIRSSHPPPIHFRN